MYFSRSVENLIAAFRGLPSDFSPLSRKRPTQQLTHIVDSAFDGIQKLLPTGSTSIEAILAQHWKSLLGEKYCHRASLRGLKKNGQLIIHVSNSTVRTELEFKKTILLRKIQSICDQANIQSISFKL